MNYTLILSSTACLTLTFLSTAYTSAANEPKDFSRRPGKQQSAIKKYLKVANAQLDELSEMIKKGKDGSSWDSACAKAEKELEDLLAESQINKDLEPWFNKHADSWRNMRLIGGKIASSNAELVESLDKLHAFEIPRSKAILTSTSSEIKNMFKEAAGDIADKAKKFINYTADAKKLGLDTPLDDLDEAIGIIKEAASKRGELNRGFNRLERAENLARRLIDKTIRHKTSYLSGMERSSQSIRRSLTQLKAKKIDSVGSGMFAKAEAAIEAQAFETLDNYREALEEWKKINQPFIKADVGDAIWLLGESTYAISTMNLPTSWEGIKIPRAGSYESRGNRAFALFSATAKTAFHHGYERWKEGYYEQVVKGQIDKEEIEASLALGEAKINYEDAIAELATKLGARREDLKDAHDKEIHALESDLLDNARELEIIIRTIRDLTVDMKSNDEDLRAATNKKIEGLTLTRDSIDDEITNLQKEHALQRKMLPEMIAREETAPWYIKEKNSIAKQKKNIADLEKAHDAKIKKLHQESGKF